ncbi:ABC transporter substrate-binding protein [Methylosinus sp. RM1]|uniref:ABC transporter substrate-binding protein n=1 Tax=Methylosinus sp. RM1 TaxID=2583817 RepID=UPI0014080342|nr:ABC transporter substrate-binding protein [Methylosinus sp. RM1]
MTTRRRFNRLLASAFVTAPFGGSLAAQSPRSGGELTVAFDGASIVKFVLDPHNSLFAPHNRVFRSIYDSLVVLRADQTVGPWLARSWEISPNRRHYVFDLREDVLFHDGSRFNAAALKFNFDRVIDPNVATYARGELGPVVATEALAPHRLGVTLAEPFEPLLRNLSSTKLGIVSPAAIVKYGEGIGQNPVGTGPFRFTGLAAGAEIRLERNPDYRWAPSTSTLSGPAWLDRLTFKNVPEHSTRVAALQSGQVQVADLVPSQHLATIRSSPDLRLVQQELLNTNYALFVNPTRAPWDDPDLRRALRLAIDVDAIVRIVYLGSLARAWSPLSPSMFASAEQDLAGSWKPDPKQAADIFESKGWRRGADGVREKAGRKLTLGFVDAQGNREQRLDVVQLVRRQLAKIGVSLTIESQSGPLLVQRQLAGDYDISGGAQFADDPDVLRRVFAPESRNRLSVVQVEDDQLADLLRKAAREDEPEARKALYLRAQRRIVDEVYAIPIYVLLYNLALSSSAQGIVIDAHGFPHFHEAWLSG